MRQAIIKELDSLPEQIKEQETIMKGLNTKKDNISYAKKSIELRHIGEVHRETNADGKAKYSNAILREEEVNNRLKGDEDYQALLEQDVELSYKLSEAVIEYNYLKNRFSSAKMKARLISNDDD